MEIDSAYRRAMPHQRVWLLSDFQTSLPDLSIPERSPAGRRLKTCRIQISDVTGRTMPQQRVLNIVNGSKTDLRIRRHSARVTLVEPGWVEVDRTSTTPMP